MNKIAILFIALALLMSSCLPASSTDVPTSPIDLDATAAVFVQQTLQALPSITTAPTNTPVMVVDTTTSTPTATLTTESATSTLTPGTNTATGTLATTTSTSTNATQTATTFTSTASFTPIPNGIVSATETLHSRFYGTLPPNLPYSGIELVNKSKAEAYISLQVTTHDGYTTILEYPVGGLFSIEAPVGKYKYVAWVGGKKILGAFSLDKNTDLRITIYKDKIEIKQR